MTWAYGLLVASASVGLAGCTLTQEFAELSRRSDVFETEMRTNMGTDASLDTHNRFTLPAKAGEPCRQDSDCNGLRCDLSVRLGLCTDACQDSPSRERERALCGGEETTCLSRDDGAVGAARCARACRPDDPSACREAFLCTGWWPFQRDGRSDEPGCSFFCASDEHCLAGQRCNRRTGQCERGDPPAGQLEDGLPCRVPASGGPSPCLGLCLALDAQGNGICGSFIDLTRTRLCPDAPERITPNVSQTADQLGLCAFRRCDEVRCCPSGLVCKRVGSEPFCGLQDRLYPIVACATDGGAGDASATDGGGDP